MDAPAPARVSALHAEHVALGADMQTYTWADMAMPWTYRTSLAEEHRAVRERAGLCDASQLQVVRVRGPGAVACLERLLPRRVGDMAPGTSRFSVVLSRFGRITDEALVLRLSDDELWLSHGCGQALRQLRAAVLDAGAGEGGPGAAGPGAQLTVDPLPTLHVLAVQGPRSLEVLEPLIAPAPTGPGGPSPGTIARARASVSALPPLGNCRVGLRTASGVAAVLVSRTGFTGELGFEVFCDAVEVEAAWHALLAAGAPSGMIPYSYSCVDLLRIEAGFTLYPNDLGVAASIFEAGLGWLVAGKQADFVGREAVERARAEVPSGRAKFRVAGVRVPGGSAGGTVPRGASVSRGGAAVGVVTSAAWSPAPGPEGGETLCLARLRSDAFQPGAAVEVGGGEVTRVGRLVELPFRPRRERGALAAR